MDIRMLKPEQIARYLLVLPALAGIGLFGFGSLVAKSHLPLMLQGTKTTGTIVDYEAKPPSREVRRTTYAPIVVFYSEQGLMRFQDWLATATLPRKGEEVRVLYDAADPSHAMIDRRLGNLLPWAPLMGFGGLFIVVAVQRWFAMRRSSRALTS